jgi:hypothetical protein
VDEFLALARAHDEARDEAEDDARDAVRDEAGASVPVVDVRYRLTPRDVFRATMDANRYSKLTVVFGIVLVSVAVTGTQNGDISAIFFVAMAAGFITGAVPAAISAFMASRRPDLLSREVWLRVGRDGVRMASPGSTTEFDWATVRRMRDMPLDFLLDFGTGAAAFVPKRVLDPAQTDGIRTLGADNGKLETSSSWAWPVFGLALGTIFTMVLILLSSASAPGL